MHLAQITLKGASADPASGARPLALSLGKELVARILMAPEGGGHGLMVMSVDPSGCGFGHSSGRRVGELGRQAVRETPPFAWNLGPDSVGKSVLFELRLGGQTRQATLKIGERPSA